MNKCAVLVFPGSNCDNDAYFVLKNLFNIEVDFVWHKSSNLDSYNMILIPGVINGITGPSAIVNKAIQVCEDRGDAFAVVAPVIYGSTISAATTEAAETIESIINFKISMYI